MMSGAVKTRSTQTGNENLPKKTMLKDYRQKQLAVKARIKYREHTLQGFKQHLKNGTFPRRMKSIKPCPKMETPEAQAIVNAACDQAQCHFGSNNSRRGKKAISRSRQLSNDEKTTGRGSSATQDPSKPQETDCGSTAMRTQRFADQIYPTLSKIRFRTPGVMEHAQIMMTHKYVTTCFNG